jgi:hypothetical protein
VFPPARIGVFAPARIGVFAPARIGVFARIGVVAVVGVWGMGRHVGLPLRYDFNHAMKMIGHDDHGVAFYVGEFIFQFEIPFFNHFSGIAQMHFTVNDVTETGHSVLATNGKKI